MKLQSFYKSLATTALLGQLLAAPLPAFAAAPTQTEQATTQKEEQSAPVGLTGFYFSNHDFTDLAMMTEEDSSTLHFDNSNLKELKPEKQKIKSVRYVGAITPTESGKYQLSTSDDKHVAIQIDGNTVVTPSGVQESITLEKGKVYPIRIEYHSDNENDINLQLYWTSPNGKKEMIPKENLLSPIDIDTRKEKEENHLIPTHPILPEDENFSSKSQESVNFSSEKEEDTELDMNTLDTDDDGLPDGWETEGFTVTRKVMKDKNNKQLLRGVKIKWENLKEEDKKSLPKYVANPYNAHTAGDPYTDLEKVTGQMDDGVKAEARNPLVAAYPAVGVNMERFILSKNKSITEGSDQSISKSTNSTSSSSKTSETGGSVTVGVNASLTSFGVSASGTLSKSNSTASSTSSSVENTTGKTLSSQLQLNTGDAAYVNPNIRYYNAGTAPMHDVKPTVSLAIGADTLATIKAQDNNIAEILVPGGTYPAKGHAAIAFKTADQFSSHPIQMNLDQLKRIENGEFLTLDVNQVEGTYRTRDKKGVLTNSKENNRWESMIQSRTIPATALLSLETGKEIVERRIAAPGTDGDGKQDNENNPELTLKEAIKIAFNATEDTKGELSYKNSDGNNISLNEKALKFVVDNNTANELHEQLEGMDKNDQKLYNVKIKQGWKIILKAYEDKPFVKPDPGKEDPEKEDPKLPDNVVKSGPQQDKDGKWIFLDEHGNQVKGWKQHTDNTWYYIGKTGDGTSLKDGEMATGLHKIKDKYYMFNAQRKCQDPDGSHGWVQADDANKTRYYIGKPGDNSTVKNDTLATGEQKIGDKYYMFKENGECETPDGYSESKVASTQKSGWSSKQDNGRYYYISNGTTKNSAGKTFENGEKVTGWLKDQDRHYYLSPNDNTKNSAGQVFKQGEMVTGWFQDGEKWYYTSPKKIGRFQEGEMRTGWFLEGVKWYYLNPTKTDKFQEGEMVTGWFKAGEMIDGSTQEGKDDYYAVVDKAIHGERSIAPTAPMTPARTIPMTFDKKGEVLVDVLATIDGYKGYFLSNGKWSKM
ncbi:binary toxin-like calcium binding domain-containing protein [Bacillus thuringiensis]|uniref:binary toxin-like calcium binding domain-containing protein n=1 Tax=Bacillus thuringiensis TaxID=1428 RepID=UPI002FFFB822